MAVFNTLIYVGSFLFIIALIFYNIKSKKNISYKLNPITVMLSAFLLLGLWLTDVLALNMSVYGLKAVSGVTSDIRTSSLLLFIIAISGMYAVTYNYYKTINKTNNSLRKTFNFSMMITLFIGLTLFMLTTIAMANAGYQGVVLGFDALGLYHSTIPLILIPTLVLMVNDI